MSRRQSRIYHQDANELDEHFWTSGAIEADLIVIDDPQRESFSVLVQHDLTR